MKEFFSKFWNSLIVRTCLWTLVLLSAGAGTAFAQSTVRGTVTDDKGNPLVGATVIVRGTSRGTTTDAKGQYSISAQKGNVLEFSYIGMSSQSVPYGGGISTLDISLKEDSAKLDEVVVVGYGTQKRASITGAVSQIEGKDLLKAPVGPVSNLLAGRVAGVVAYQGSGTPGADGSSLLVRGSAAKYIVDGVAREFDQINPDDIETVSILKDASSASIYGLDAQSVVIVTTKKGKIAPAQISYTGSYALSQNALMYDMLDGPEYAYWYNKALQMEGKDPIYTKEMVQMMKNGTGGWGNTDWYKETFGTGHTQSHSMSVSGGTDRITYFTSLGYYDQDGNVEGFTFSKLNARSNIEAKIAKNLTMTFNIAARVEKRKQPGFGSTPDDYLNFGQQAFYALPFLPKEYDGLPVASPTASAAVNPLASSKHSGYNKVDSKTLQTNIALRYDFPFLKGLSAKFSVAYDYSDTYSKIFSTPYRAMYAKLPTSTAGSLTYAEDWDSRKKSESALTEGYSRSMNVMTNTSVNYANRFGLHNIAAILLVETYSNDNNKFSARGEGFAFNELPELSEASIKELMSISGSSGKTRKAGFAGRINYDYDNRYLAEVSFRYDGNYLFAGFVSGKRWVPLPAASLGWRISNEKWFNSRIIDNLKLRGSVGLTASSGDIKAYTYLNTLSALNNIAVIGGSGVSGLQTSNPANVNLTWPKTLQYNGGFDLSMWNGKLGLEFDVFYKYIYDLVSSVSNTFPDSFGGFYFSQANNNKQAHKGFEFTLSHRNRVGELNYDISLTGTYTKRKWLSYTDAANTPDYLKLTGKEVGSQQGFIAQGLFQSQEEIDSSPTLVGSTALPGDIKYLDRNGDGMISYDQDRGYVGGTVYPKFVGGLSFGLGWKGIDFSFLFQVGLGRTVSLTGVYSGIGMDNSPLTKPFYHNGNSPKYLLENGWTEENRNAEFPRLRINSSSPHNNNSYSSTFWYRNGDYLRLKNLQIGYTLPNKWTRKIGVEKIRIYAEGQNLWTVSELSKYGIDPEAPNVTTGWGFYPQQRVYAFGLNLSF